MKLDEYVLTPVLKPDIIMTRWNFQGREWHSMRALTYTRRYFLIQHIVSVACDSLPAECRIAQNHSVREFTVNNLIKVQSIVIKIPRIMSS